MRSLVKGACPKVLTDNAVKWTQEIVDKLAAGEKPTDTQRSRYNHPDVKSALRGEILSKCAYCESKITHVDHGDIEHVVPKSKVPSLAFEWVNLTLACRICNQRKGDFHDGGDDHSRLIDPYIDNPSDHFIFHREIIVPRPDSPRGLLTDDKIGLSRAALREQRQVRMDFIDGLLRGYCNATDIEKPILLANLKTLCCSDGSEYSALAIVYIDDMFSRLGI